MVLGDRFPASIKTKHIRSNYQPGRILYLYSNDTTPPKNKYFLVAHTEPEPLLLIINSEIHEFVIARPKLFICQVQIKSDSKNQLPHDSYIDCRNAWTEFNTNDLFKQIDADMSRIKGVITLDTRDHVLTALKACTTLEPRYKRIAIGGLSSIS